MNHIPQIKIMKPLLKQILPHVISILAFLVVSSAYFHPAWDGKSLQGEDVVGSYGSDREKKDFQKYEEEYVLWNGAIFGGMPNLIFAKFDGSTNIRNTYDIPIRMGLPREVISIFWYMLGFYILLIWYRMRQVRFNHTLLVMQLFRPDSILHQRNQ